MSQAQSPPPEARIGQVVDDRYRIVEHIASGGMASVYRAEHVSTHAPVAVKVMHRELTSDPELAARFQREVQACRAIGHPNVIAAIDFGRMPDNCPFMVLEYTPGNDLCVVLHYQKPFDQVRAIKIALQVCLALTAAHAVNVIHRDLKPDNIMLVARDGDPDFVKVVDFGIAKMPTRTNQPLTALGSVFGTPEYLSPEQARGQTIDHRSDLYTVGIVIYEMLTGATPFASPNLGQVIMAQLSKAPPPLSPQIDGELRILVSELLAKDPASRPQTAAEVATRLAHVLARLAPGHPLLAQVPGAQAVAPAYQQPSPPIQAPAPAPVVAAAPIAPQAFAPVPVAVAPPAPAPAPQYQAPAPNYPREPAPAPQYQALTPNYPQPAAPTFANPDPIEIPTNRGGCAVVWVGLGVLVVLACVLGLLVYRMM